MKRIGNYVQELIRANVQGKKAVTNNAMRLDKKKAFLPFLVGFERHIVECLLFTVLYKVTPNDLII